MTRSRCLPQPLLQLLGPRSLWTDRAETKMPNCGSWIEIGSPCHNHVEESDVIWCKQTTVSWRFFPAFSVKLHRLCRMHLAHTSKRWLLRSNSAPDSVVRNVYRHSKMWESENQHWEWLKEKDISHQYMAIQSNIGSSSDKSRASWYTNYSLFTLSWATPPLHAESEWLWTANHRYQQFYGQARE